MNHCSNQHSLGIAVDIGTTTVAMALVEKSTGAILSEVGFMNPQKKHGSDVAGRIRFGSTKEGAEQLGILIKKEIVNGILNLLEETKQELEQIDELVISANTAMRYLFLERTTEKLGSYPFTMEDVGFASLNFIDVFQSVLEKETIENSLFYKGGNHIKVVLLPCISTFVGGDITSGLYDLGFPKEKGCYLFLDLGTNGEMAISGEKGFFATSVPAGPAFEASLRGQGRRGTTLIQWIARARCRGQIGIDGKIAKRYEQTGIPLEDNIYLKQEILRKLQLAKGALLAGIELLLKQYKANPEEIVKVYLAGSFGFHLDIQSAILIGMLPANLQSKIEIVGNTSLHGAIQCLLEEKREERLEAIVNQVTAFNLAETEQFHQLFLERMVFKSMKLKNHENK